MLREQFSICSEGSALQCIFISSVVNFVHINSTHSFPFNVDNVYLIWLFDLFTTHAVYRKLDICVSRVRQSKSIKNECKK